MPAASAVGEGTHADHPPAVQGPPWSSSGAVAADAAVDAVTARGTARQPGYGFRRGYGGYGGGNSCLRDLLLLNVGCCAAESLGCGTDAFLLAPTTVRAVRSTAGAETSLADRMIAAVRLLPARDQPQAGAVLPLHADLLRLRRPGPGAARGRPRLLAHPPPVGPLPPRRRRGRRSRFPLSRNPHAGGVPGHLTSPGEHARRPPASRRGRTRCGGPARSSGRPRSWPAGVWRSTASPSSRTSTRGPRRSGCRWTAARCG